jgi:hypothetical protein
MRGLIHGLGRTPVTMWYIANALFLQLAGVGAGLQPPEFLKPGTVMEVTISEIGTLRNSVTFA